MEERIDLKRAKEQELIASIYNIKEIVPFTGENISEDLIYQKLNNNNFITISAPQEPPLMMSLLTMDTLKNYKSGQSIKPGNIKLNIKKLVDCIPSTVPIIYSIIYDNPILQISSALILWKSIKNIMTVEIRKEQAIVLIALWKKCNSDHEISLDEGFIDVKNAFNEFEETEISFEKYNEIIDQLSQIQCIELNNNIIWLREWISKNYI
ncbi:MAG: hypothetical protein R3Y58_13405 [Eubacteriales bacterium]